MGQKVHPIGFRLGQIQNHSIQWFATSKKEYSKFLLEDQFIRQLLLKYSKTIHQIQIIRQFENHIKIIISGENPYNVLGSKNLKEFKNFIKKNIQKYRKNTSLYHYLNINYPTRILSPKLTLLIISCKLNASFIAQYLVNLFEKRYTLKAAIKKLFRFFREQGQKKYLLSKDLRYKGLKIKISGRINGTEIARSESIRKGCLPLHTLNMNIDYSFKKASTIYGILGIKVWLLK